MSDDLSFQTTPATPPSGTVVKTDNVGGKHVQFVKLMDGTNDGTGQIAGDAANGLDVDVTRLPALPAGTNAIGKLAANSGVDIGDVDVTSVTPGTGATNLGKLEDAPHSSGDVGVLSLAVRRDANTTLVDTDGDNAALQVDATGSLKVAIISGAGSGGTAMTDDTAFTPGTTSVTPAAGVYRTTRDSVDDADAGALAMTAKRALLSCIETPLGDSAMDDTNDAVRVNIVAGAASGGTSQQDDSAFTPGTGSLTPIGALADETTPDSVDEGDVGIPRMSLNRVLYSQLRDGQGNERGAYVTAANALKTDGSGVTQPVSDASGSLTVDAGVTAPVAVRISDGAAFIDPVSVVPVNDNSGSLTTDTAGDTAHDAADAGNPVKVGARAINAVQTLVSATNDRTDLVADLGGRLLVAGTPRELITHATTTIASSTSETTVLSAGAAGIFHDVTMVKVTNTSGTACRVDFKDATAGTTRFSIICPAGEERGFTCGTTDDPVTQASAANNWTATCSASVSDIRVFIKARKTK